MKNTNKDSNPIYLSNLIMFSRVTRIKCYSNSSLALESLDEQGKYLKRSELVGEEATQRLEALDKQRAAFEDSLEVYFAERNDVLNDSALSENEQQETIAQLRTEHFLPEQLRRVEAIERIRANEAKQ